MDRGSGFAQLDTLNVSVPQAQRSPRVPLAIFVPALQSKAWVQFLSTLLLQLQSCER